MVHKKTIIIFLTIILLIVMVNSITAILLFDASIYDSRTLLTHIKVISIHLFTQGLIVFIFLHLYGIFYQSSDMVYIAFGCMLINNITSFIGGDIKLLAMISFYLCLVYLLIKVIQFVSRT